MHIRRWVLTPLVIALFIIAAVSLAPVLAQQQQQPPKVDKKVDQGQKFDIQEVIKVADAAKAGTPPADIAASFRCDFLKAQEGRTYVPFTITIAPDQMPASRSLNMFVRVVNKALEGAPAAPAADAKKDSKDKNAPKNAHPGVRVPAAVPAEPAGGGARPALQDQPRVRGAGRRVRRLRRRSRSACPTTRRTARRRRPRRARSSRP